MKCSRVSVVNKDTNTFTTLNHHFDLEPNRILKNTEYDIRTVLRTVSVCWSVAHLPNQCRSPAAGGRRRLGLRLRAGDSRHGAMWGPWLSGSGDSVGVWPQLTTQDS